MGFIMHDFNPPSRPAVGAIQGQSAGSFRGWAGAIAATGFMVACTPAAVQNAPRSSRESSAVAVATAADAALPDEPTASVATAAPLDRTAYEEIEIPPDGVWPNADEPGARQISPFALAQDFMVESQESDECFRSKQARVEALDNGMTAVIMTEMGLCDDSLSGLEYRYDFNRDGRWAIDWGGLRYHCSRTSPPRWAAPGTLCP